jgi:hypothetical protein
MTTFTHANSMSRLVLLGSAAFLLQAGGVLAADRADDAQAQARELLAGTAKRSPAAATSAALPAATSQAALAPQEQARRLILGTPRAGTGVKSYAALDSKGTSSSGAQRRGIRRGYSDAQALAQRMITRAG